MFCLVISLHFLGRLDTHSASKAMLLRHDRACIATAMFMTINQCSKLAPFVCARRDGIDIDIYISPLCIAFFVEHSTP